MRARGYDMSTLELAERRCQIAEELRAKIHSAFAGVTLGEGVGLYEGQAIDGYADDAARKRSRERDEKVDWRAIPSEDLNRCNSSLSFFDSLGMRFHLPAFMLAELEGRYYFDLMFHLVQSADFDRHFSLLNTEQRQVIRTFLLVAREEPEFRFEREHVDRALMGYWGENPAAG